MTKSTQKTRNQPSHYSSFSFHLIRTCSLISSLVVSAILLYFCYHLKHENYKIPWTFLVLLAVSLLTIVSLSATFALHLCHVLPPLLNLCINAPLFGLWCLGLALLGWNMSGTLTHVCNGENWGSSAGIMICRIYKALFSFTVFGWLAAVAQVTLDVIVRRRQVRSGKYNKMGGPERMSYNDGKNGSAYGLGGLGGMVNHVADAAPKGHAQVAVEPMRGQEVDLGYGHWKQQGKESVRVNQFGYEGLNTGTGYDSGYGRH